ncbi:hypothetical protein EYF80_020133 [Liparis tanakae]|uniref:Uncharacterized protein n=1 Tax=Liparis tanakae TaxID=230148 RepID=A0A4Z2HXF6_9TELE|nr:hypothetical protein EYF80_020133 [Liparis tanakae]
MPRLNSSLRLPGTLPAARIDQLRVDGIAGQTSGAAGSKRSQHIWIHSPIYSGYLLSNESPALGALLDAVDRTAPEAYNQAVTRCDKRKEQSCCQKVTFTSPPCSKLHAAAWQRARRCEAERNRTFTFDNTHGDHKTNAGFSEWAHSVSVIHVQGL